MQELARWPAIAREPQAAAWLADLVRRGLASNTVTAYARGVSEYLERCYQQSVDPLGATRADVAGYVRALTSRSSQRGSRGASDDSPAGLANATTRRERIVPYSASTGALLQRYLVWRQELTTARGPLFLSESRRNRGHPISLWTWSKVVQRLAQQADVPRFTTHTLRHLCLTDLARGGWELHLLASFAGHRSTSSTLQYIHLSGRDLSAKLAAGLADLHAQRSRSLAPDDGTVPS